MYTTKTDCGEKGDCHPKCQWKCDSPVCNQVCEPICEQPRCSTRCQELGCSKCAIKCDKPQCEVRCPVKHCEKGACPKCDTVCKEPQCHTECTNPTPKCESVCEEPLCDWKCHRPADCQKPRCALVCEKSPHCQPQPPKADCCACAKAEVKTEEPKNSKSNYWLNSLIFENKPQRDNFLKETNSNKIMTRPIWTLMNNLPMFKNSQSDDLKNSIWLSERVVNIPSSVVV